MEGSRLIRKPADLMKGKTAKEPGSIAVYSGSIRWEPAPGSKAEAISVQLTSITGKLQKAKGAAVMRVPLQSRSLVFGFQSVDDRESILDVLNQCLAALPSALPAAAGTAGAATVEVPGIQASAEELQMLQKVVLQEHADVRKLYQSLVEGGVLSAGEFWKGKVVLLQQEASRRRSGQCTGLSSSMLSSLPGTMDGNANTLQFKVSPEMVRQIFVEKPSVHRAYIANVPRSMTEKEFWTRYFRYMKALQERRHSSATGTLTASHALQGEDELLFKRHEKEQEDRERASQRLRSVDPTVDLAADGFDSVGAGYGMAHRPHGRETAAGRAADIMGDLNRHANAVVDGVPVELRSKAAASTDETAQAVSAAMKKAVAADAAASQRAGGRARARQALEMPDLQPPEAVRYSELTIADPTRYFSTKSDAAPAVKREAGEQPGLPGARAPERPNSAAEPGGGAAPEVQMGRSLDLLQRPDRELGCYQRQHSMQAIHTMLHGKPDEEDSFASGTSSIRSASALSRVIPAEVIEMERARALAINELLRHFYGALPGGRSRKLARLHEALVGEDVKIKSFQDALPGQQRHAFTRLLRPLCAALDVAFQKYQAMEQRASREPARKPA